MTGSGKTLAYLLLIFSVVNSQRSAIQAVIVVPTRELGMQVTKVTRILAAKSSNLELEQKACSVMILLDGGTLRRHKSWLKSEKSKKARKDPPTIHLVVFLKTSHEACPELVLLEEDMNFNQRASSLTGVKQAGGFLLVATDIAARGVDLPETTHIYNFDLPKDAVNYLHRAGRTGRKPFSESKCFVTSIISAEERFVLQRFESELLFDCEELVFQIE